MTATEAMTWPAGSEAWFVCRAADVVDDIMISLRDGTASSEAEIAKAGRMRAARIFKRRHGFHPCRKVDCEFQAVETPADRAKYEG